MAEPRLIEATTSVSWFAWPRRLSQTIVGAILSRGIGLIVPVVLIPPMLAYLGPETYGLWAAIVALIAMATFADLGLGSSLLTLLIPCYSEGDTDKAQRYISSAYFALVMVAVGTCGAVWLLSSEIVWSTLFNVAGDVTESRARAMSLICITAYAVSLPLSLVGRVQYAYQQVTRSNLWQMAGAVSSVPMVLGSIYLKMSAVTVVAASVVGPVIVSCLNNIWFFTRKMPNMSPRIGRVGWLTIRQLFPLSMLFLSLNVAAAAALSSDAFIIAHALSLQAVTNFAVPAKLFALLGALISVLALALWPANGAALTAGNIAWVRNTTRRMTLILTSTVFLLSVALIFSGHRLLGEWTSHRVESDLRLLVGFGLWYTIFAFASSMATVQFSAGVVGPQLLGWTAFLCVSVPAKWYGARYFGISSVPYIGSGLYLMTVLPAVMIGYHRVLAKSISTAPQTQTRVYGSPTWVAASEGQD